MTCQIASGPRARPPAGQEATARALEALTLATMAGVSSAALTAAAAVSTLLLLCPTAEASAFIFPATHPSNGVVGSGPSAATVSLTGPRVLNGGVSYRSAVQPQHYCPVTTTNTASSSTVLSMGLRSFLKRNLGKKGDKDDEGMTRLRNDQTPPPAPDSADGSTSIGASSGARRVIRQELPVGDEEDVDYDGDDYLRGGPSTGRSIGDVMKDIGASKETGEGDKSDAEKKAMMWGIDMSKYND